MKSLITVEVLVNAPREKIWQYWTGPGHIVHWNFASDDWCSPRATNDLRVGGKFNYRMEAKDGSTGFDFEGMYTLIEENTKIEYVLAGDDERKVCIEFFREREGCRVVETFEAEAENPLELQKNGWQAILSNFKKYGESR